MFLNYSKSPKKCQERVKILLVFIYSDFSLNLSPEHSSFACQEILPGHAGKPNEAKQLQTWTKYLRQALPFT